MSRGLTTEAKKALVDANRQHETDTGSTDVQVAILTQRISELTAHAKVHGKDHHTRLGLTKMVAKRRRLLDYLKREDFDRYKALIERLGIRR